MSDAIHCFQFISDNVPEWVKVLDALEQKVKERQEQVLRIPIPARKQLKKSNSNESIRPNSSGNGTNSVDEIVSPPQDNDTTQPLDYHQLFLQSRKRKTTSRLSNDSSPSKSRSRHMIIVYYDSEIQKMLEQLVRSIGTARNNIRKARSIHRMEMLMSGKMDYDSPGKQSAEGTSDAFSSADTTLEEAQSLCERGAHRFLREGECHADIVGAKNSFQKSKEISDVELGRLKLEDDIKRKDEEVKQQQRSAATISSEESKDSNTTLVNDDDPEMDNPTKATLLEVDEDDDGAGINIDDPEFMKRFRMHSRRTMGQF